MTNRMTYLGCIHWQYVLMKMHKILETETFYKMSMYYKQMGQIFHFLLQSLLLALRLIISATFELGETQGS
jgi:hypothetical protein